MTLASVTRWQKTWRVARSIILCCSIFLLSGILYRSVSPIKTYVSITFDDGYADQMQAAKQLELHGMRGTFYIISSKVGQPGYFTWEQLEALQARGHEIGGHTLTHPNLTKLTGYELRHEICDDRVALSSHRLSVTSFAYSYGQSNDETVAAVDLCGYNSARSVVGKQESLPPVDVYQLRTMDPIQSDTTLTDLRQWVKQAERKGSQGGWVQLVFHHICEGCDQYATTPQDFNDFLSWLREREYTGTTVRTINEVIGGPIKPLISAEK